MKNVILLSGGVESTTLLHLLAAKHELAPLFIDYGQRNVRQEKRAALWQCEQLGQSLQIMPAARVGQFFRGNAALSRHVPIPHRNLVALSLSVSWASQIGAGAIYLGINAEDAAADSASTPGFIAAFRHSVQQLGNITLHTPFADMSKAEIVARGHTLGVNLAHSWSCLLGHPRHCGQCPQCLKRKAAFAAAGIAEPARFYRQP